MRNYETARTLFSFLEFAAWMIAIVGVILAFYGAGNAPRSSQMIFAIPGVMIGVLGLVLAGVVQAARAGVDTAEYTQQMLQISRAQLEVSQQAKKQGLPREEGYARQQAARDEILTGTEALPAPAASYSNARTAEEIASEAVPQAGETIDYRGNAIRVIKDGFFFDDTFFSTLDEARARIDDDKFASNQRSSRPKSITHMLPEE